jgi:hypothetical protein
MREAVLVAFLRRTSHQPAFVVMGPGSGPGRRIVYDALARPNPMDSTFKQLNHVIASEAKQSIAQQAESWIASLRSQ